MRKKMNQLNYKALNLPKDFLKQKVTIAQKILRNCF